METRAAEVIGPVPSGGDALRLIEALAADGGISPTVLDITHVGPGADRRLLSNSPTKTPARNVPDAVRAWAARWTPFAADSSPPTCRACSGTRRAARVG